jgi:hypothetical protein
VSASEGFYSAALSDGSGAVLVAELPLRLPDDKVGILVERPDSMPAAPRSTAFGRRSASVVAASSRLEWIEVEHSQELMQVALTMARSSAIVSVVMCPLGVSPARTALAQVVGDILRSCRGPGRPPIMCAVRPGVGVGRTAIPHEVELVIEHTGEKQVRHVYEIVSWENIPEWLAGLSSSRAAA